MTLELVDVNGARWEMPIQRAPTDEQVAERLWRQPTLRVRPLGYDGEPNWTLVSRHVVAYRVEAD